MSVKIKPFRSRWMIWALLFTVHRALFVSPAVAQPLGAQLLMSEVFKQMPDSLFPYLTANNRLDMIDFMEAKMKAEVTNALEGTSEMMFLSDDSLSIRMNASLRIDMRLTERDSLVVEVAKTYTINGQQEEKLVQYFSASWCPLSAPVLISSSLTKRDEEIFDKPHF